MRFVFTAPRYHTNQHFSMKALLDAGHEVSFLALRRGRSEVYDVLDPMVLGESWVTRVLGRESLSMPPMLRFLKELWRLKPDTVVVRNPLSAYGALSFLAARLLGSTVVFYSQTPAYRKLSPRRRIIRMIPAWIARARWITPVLGDPDKHALALGILRYVPFAMEPQTAPEHRRWFRDDRINIICVGKFMERKNHLLFLQAVWKLAQHHDVQATIVGECVGEDAEALLTELRGCTEELDLNERVCFKTNLSYWEVQREYAEHDLFVLPSSDEPAAVSHLEAMSHSLPVICSDTNGTQCYIRPCENGYIFRSADVDDLERCMERVVTDRSTLVDMGARSYDLVISDHSPADYVNNLVAIAEGCG